MSLRDEINEGWQLALAKSAKDASHRAFPLRGAGGGILAIVSPEGVPGILIPLPRGDAVAIQAPLRPGAGGIIEAEVTSWNSGGVPNRALTVSCSTSDKADAFLHFCESLILRCVSGQACGTAFATCVDDFRGLFGATDAPASDTVGLVGELIVLTDLMRISPKLGVTWDGPAGSRHDFRNGPCAIEVKSTLRSEAAGSVVTISAMDQLVVPDSGQLFLHFVRLETDPRGELSLEDLMREALSLVGDDQLKFLLRMFDMSGTDAKARGKRFSLVSRESFHLAEGFPALTSEKLIQGRVDPGVSNVSYKLDLNVASSYRVADNVMLSTFGGV